MGIRMDGKALADEICLDLKYRCHELIKNENRPALMIVTTGDDSASKVYVKNKVRRCEEIGIYPIVRHFDYLTEPEFFGLIRNNKTPIIVQEPIAGDVDHRCVATTLNPLVDVDGFSFNNVADLAMDNSPINYPCTPDGIMYLLDDYGISVSGKSALVIGRSNIVGRPMAMMLEHEGATVTVAHSKTPEDKLYELIQDSDIIVSAVGKAEFITSEKYNSHFWYDDNIWVDFSDKVIIDVGMNRDKNGKLCGDFSEELKERAGWFTSTPGGTGPMTVAMLMRNVIRFYEKGSYNYV